MDIVDHAQMLEEQARAEALAARPVTQPVKLDLRRRVVCRDCGERIASERLRSVPFTRRCLDCEARWERRRRLG